MYNYVIAQIFGACAILIVGYSYLQKKKSQYVLLQIFSNICFIAQFFFLCAYSAILTSFISLIRTLVFFFLEKRGKKIHIAYLLIFQVLIIIAGIFTYDGLISLIPVIIASLYGVGMYVKDLRKTYTLTTINSVMWIFYNFMIKAHANFLGNIFELVLSVIGLIKMIKYKSEQNNNK